ncbi:hypothetical protein G7K_6880-t1 [Saitoella complicata NRRL Y-17804]|uniref:Uncharacterized protein n=1 Tax=Saitoella complicata (strain BCRC 22490 / CBS 7301 / JCM 7358 / NBRC 10748 / NRRL Y-17804) TaxID=698492 RepID=A0A0E9NSS0_SAICN|nr:hypothetical protein G7K_6880-t1 [Saitoella complicata NRRL Y-17804]
MPRLTSIKSKYSNAEGTYSYLSSPLSLLPIFLSFILSILKISLPLLICCLSPISLSVLTKTRSYPA